MHRCILRNRDGECHCRKRLHRADLPFIQVEHPKKALVIGPTYSEYEREIALGGGTTLYYPLREADDFKLNVEDFLSHLNESIDLLVICNPNNPTSSSIPRSDMRHILDVCKQYDIYVMVDETYVEFADNMAELTAVPLTNYYNNIVILRGTSKFFAAPGLRLGYAVTGNRDLIKSINTRKNPWTINSLAVIAGETMFTDSAYIKETKSLISSERARLCKLFNKNPDFKVYDQVPTLFWCASCAKISPRRICLTAPSGRK